LARPLPGHAKALDDFEFDLVMGIACKRGVGYGLAPEGRVCSRHGHDGSLVIIDVDRRVTFAFMMN
jgi:hypothetical protein